MTFRERQTRLTRYTLILGFLTLIPLSLSLFDLGEFTTAGVSLYAILFLAFAVPALFLSVQHARALHREGRQT